VEEEPPNTSSRSSNDETNHPTAPPLIIYPGQPFQSAGHSRSQMAVTRTGAISGPSCSQGFILKTGEITRFPFIPRMASIFRGQPRVIHKQHIDFGQERQEVNVYLRI
jgi:hypothetical protein